ncbi:MAG: hypothetical protein K9H64_05520 [Bacteroidales bacterium]|nr:hypothetical protein [Bacteroidales bacterium]MCF8455759.1 hypothetical protein [Bacteroidales bacterium]
MTFDKPQSTLEFLSTGWVFLLLLLIGVAIVRAKDKFEFDFDGKVFSNYVQVFGIRLFTDTKKLPDKILFVNTVKRKLTWKRYIALAIPFTSEIITYEVYLVSLKGKAGRLVSLEENEAKELSAKIAELYGVEWRFKEQI